MPISDCHLYGGGAVAALEARLRAFYGVRHALCVSSASTGLLAVGLALNLRRSDFVTTPYTYGATLSGWLLLGNRPVFADIDPHTLALDPESARQWITPRTKAIIPVHLYGQPADMSEFQELARRTLWQAKPDRNATIDGLGITITKRTGRDWLQQ